MSKSILSITASVQSEGSLSRQLTAELIEHLTAVGEVEKVVERDLSDNTMDLLTAEHVGAFFTPAEDRSEEQRKLLQQSEALVDELLDADTLIIGTPMYNFSVPAVLKAWIDMICRVGRTFKYTEQGPVGLSTIDTAYIVVATGGSPIGSEIDFVVPYLTQVAKFIGVKEVKVIAADKVNQDRDAGIANAREAIKAA